MMKIVFTDDIIYAYASGTSSAAGGAERQQWLLARALASRGWSVGVGVRKALEVGKRTTIDGVEFLGVGQGQNLSVWRRTLLAEQPDWWYWRSANHIWGAGVEIAKALGVRTIFAASFDLDVEPRRALTRRRSWWPLYAWGLHRADKILLQHKGQLSRLPKHWCSKAHIVPSIAGDSAPVKPHAERASYVAWVGMLRQHKRPDLLIEIARKAPTLCFVVCGGPSPHRSPPGYGDGIVRELLRLPNVEFLNQVPSAKACEIIAEAALLLSTSDEEGFPNTFLQAWSSGTPVVSLRVDPDGVIVKAGLGAVSSDLDGAIGEIHALINSSRQREEIAGRARHHVSQTHSEAAVATAFIRAVANRRVATEAKQLVDLS
jgi:glycosyltransferase involved in cell wall biosynthesis